MPKRISIIFPIFNEELNILPLVERLESGLFNQMKDVAFEVIFVDDHSTDNTAKILKDVCQEKTAAKYIRLSKNQGSHVAILAGMNYVTGDVVIFMAADLQDPPELIKNLIDMWRKGSHIVWAVRKNRIGLSFKDKLLANLFYRLLNFSSPDKLPPQGSDFALLDRKVVSALLKSVGRNPSLGIDIAGLGFDQNIVYYSQSERKFGSSSWTLNKRLKAFADAFVSSSYLPLRSMSYLGFIISIFGFLGSIIIIYLKLSGKTQMSGWPSMMVILFVLGGIQMTMLGVIGEYLWRTLEESRARPLYILEDSRGIDVLGEHASCVDSDYLPFDNIQSS